MTTIVVFVARFLLCVLGSISDAAMIEKNPIRTGIADSVATAGFLFLGWYTIAEKSVAAVVACSLAGGLASGLICWRRKAKGAE